MVHVAGISNKCTPKARVTRSFLPWWPSNVKEIDWRKTGRSTWPKFGRLVLARPRYVPGACFFGHTQCYTHVATKAILEVAAICWITSKAILKPTESIRLRQEVSNKKEDYLERRLSNLHGPSAVYYWYPNVSFDSITSSYRMTLLRTFGCHTHAPSPVQIPTAGRDLATA